MYRDVKFTSLISEETKHRP